jgi:hypothetical protein
LSYISIFSVLVPLILGIIFYTRLEPNSRILVLMLAFASISQLSSFFLTNWNKIWVFYNIYTFIDSAFWGYLFYKNSENRRIRYTITTIILLQAIVSVYIFSYAGINKRFFSEFVCLNSLLELFWVLSFFYERYKREEIEALEKEPMFWFCLGILIYDPTTYFLFAFYDIVRHSPNPQYKSLWTIHDFLNACMYLIFAVGIYVNVVQTSKFRHTFIPNES